MIKELRKKLKKLSDKKRASVLASFFKTGSGEYGEGDIFIGIKVPEQKALIQEYKLLSLSDIKKLLRSQIHEERSLALGILKKQYQENKNQELVNFYLSHTKFINNWDLVDMSASYILGDWFLTRDRRILFKLAKSKNLWEKRIAIISTFAFIKNDDFKDCFKLYRLLLQDQHDLIHKALGWMLREIGKRNLREEENFLKQYYKTMPRTMLRYAIERFPEKRRQAYLNGKI